MIEGVGRCLCGVSSDEQPLRTRRRALQRGIPGPGIHGGALPIAAPSHTLEPINYDHGLPKSTPIYGRSTTSHPRHPWRRFQILTAPGWTGGKTSSTTGAVAAAILCAAPGSRVQAEG